MSLDIDKVKDELKVFDKFTFYEEPHVYIYKDKDGNEVEISKSVTSLIEDYSNIFDKENAATKKALKCGVSKESILDEWENNNKFSKIKGTVTHAYNEYLWSNREYEYDKNKVIDEFGEDVIAPIWDKLKSICNKFYDKFHDHLISVGLEQVIGSIDYDIAGSIDFLGYSKKLDSLIIIDYKTNKEIREKSFNNQCMLKPLDKIPDCNYYHYSLQLSLYKTILEHETNLKVSNKKWLIWINENNDTFKLYECKDLDKYAKIILDSRIKK